MKKFEVYLSNNETITFHTNKNLIDVIDCFTKEKYIEIYEDGKFSEVIFRKHIVKIIEVNNMIIEPNGYKMLKDENKTIKDQCHNWENEYYEVVNENDKQDKYIAQLEYENTKLKQELEDFYYERSKHKETNFYIKALKNQLFKAYLHHQQQERLISELKTSLSSYNNFVDEMFPD